MHSNRTPFRLMLVVPMLFALTACGSGGGSTTTLTPAFLSPDAFEGSWRQVGISGTAGGPEGVASSWGSVQVAGGTLDLARTTATMTAMFGESWIRSALLKNMEPERLEAMADAGHFLVEDQPDYVNARLVRFLRDGR